MRNHKTPFPYKLFAGLLLTAIFLVMAIILGSICSLNANADTPPGNKIQAVQSGAWSVGRTWNLSSSVDSVSVVGSVSVLNFPGVQAASQSGNWSVGRTWSLSGVSDSVAITSLPSLPSGTNAIGTVAVSNFPASQPVSGSVSVTNFPATQTVGGTVAVSNFPASTQISNFPATQAVSGSVAVSNFPATQAVSAASLPLPAGAATEATLASVNAKTPALGQATMAASSPVAIASNQSPIPVTGAFYQATQPVSGTVAVSNFPATQAVSGSLGRSWNLLNTTDSVNVGNFPASQAVTAAALPLPAGASTEATLAAINTKVLAKGQATSANSAPVTIASDQSTLPVNVGNFPATQTVAGSVAVTNFPASTQVSNFPATQNVAGTVAVSNFPSSTQVSNFPATQAVSAASLPLPSGASTEATLSAINTKVLPKGQGTMANSAPVTIASDQSTLPVSGAVSVSNFPATQAVSAASLPLPAGAATESTLSALNAKVPAKGAATTANSTPVNIASDQVVQVAGTFYPATQPISAAALPLPAGAATETTLGTLNGKVPSGLTVSSTRLLTDGSGVVQPVSQNGTWSVGRTWALTAASDGVAAAQSGTWNLNNISGTVSLPTGASTAALQGTGNTSLASIDAKTPALQSGSVPVAITNLASPLPVVNSSLPLPAGASTAANQTALAALVQTLVDNQGMIRDTNKATYSTSISLLTAAASPTDVAQLCGSATKTVRLTRAAFSGTMTTGGQRDVFLIKRSTADTGGTATTLPPFAHDSNSPAGTASAKSFSANPTLGTQIGIYRTRKIYLGTVGNTNSDEMLLDFGTRPAQTIVLRGAGECVAFNLNGATSAGNSLNISFEWTEE